MKFESLLARRYIRAQKRHSLLTTCSIMIAVALMVMLFSTFTTLMGIMRDTMYDEAPYHVMFTDVTREQAAEIRHMNQVASAELIEKPGGGYAVQVMFNTYLDNELEFFQKMIDNLHLRASISDNGQVEGMEINDSLMRFDQINLAGKYQTACCFALFFIFVIFFALTLRLVIDTAFEVSSKERERQFGVLQSVGATPKQIVRILTVEGMMLSGFGVPLGVGVGLLLTLAAYKAVLATGVAEAVLEPEKISKIVQLHINPLMTAIAAIVGIAWVFFSAYGTGMRIIKMSPVQAITSRAKTVKKVKKHTFLSLIFGWTGKLASRNARRNRKRFIITVLSLTLSLTLFASVSSVLHQMETSLRGVFMSYDEFGEILPDFALETNLEPEKPAQSPTAFAECIKMLEDTGYFKNFDHKTRRNAKIHAEGTAVDDEQRIAVYYVSRYTYQRIFGEKPEISYDDLTKSGSGILLNAADNGFSADIKELTLDIQRSQEITKEEYIRRYEAAVKEIIKNDPKREKDFADGRRTISAESKGNAYIITRDYSEKFPPEDGVFCEMIEETVTFPVAGTFEQETPTYLMDDGGQTRKELFLILTDDTWITEGCKTFGPYNKWSYDDWLTCNLVSEEDYPAAKQFLTDHKEIFGYYTEDDDEYGGTDMYAQMKKLRTLLSAEHVGLTFLLVLIALIAIVNMVNIVSTGIINRKSELASMQCVGMTRGQMYRLAIIECLQFTLWAGVAATLLCIVIGIGTYNMMGAFDLTGDIKPDIQMIIEAVAKIWIASIFAFLCALAASLIPLHMMQKEPLVEQIRAVE